MGSARSLATGTGLILIRTPSSCLHHPVSHLTLILVDSDSKFEYSREKQCPEKDQRRQIDAEMFRHSLMTWGEKFSANEIDDAFAEFKIDGGMIDGGHLKSIMVAKKEGEE